MAAPRVVAALAAVAGLTMAGLASRSLADGDVLETFPFEDRAGRVKAFRDAQTFERQCRAKGILTHIAGPFYEDTETGPGRYEIHTNVLSRGRPPVTRDPVLLYGEILRVFPFESRKDQGKAHQGASTYQIEVRKLRITTQMAGPFYDDKEAGPGRYEVTLIAAKAARDWGLAYPWAPIRYELPRDPLEPRAGPKRFVGHSPFRNLGWQIHAYLQALEIVKMLEGRGRSAFIAGPFPSKHPGAGWWDVYEDLRPEPQTAEEPAPEPPQAVAPQTQPQPEPSALPTQVYAAAAQMRLFSKPDASSPAPLAVARGTALRVVGEMGDWYAVLLPDGKRGGWVPKAFTSTVAPQP